MKPSIRKIRKGRIKKSTSGVDINKYPPEISVRFCFQQTQIQPGELVFFHSISSDLYHNIIDELIQLPKNLWVRWHQNAHWIADEDLQWRELIPSWNTLVNEVERIFQFTIDASRLNRFDSNDYKPFHNDASAIISSLSKKQNISVALCLGSNRNVRFFHPASCTSLDFQTSPMTLYGFGTQVNRAWMHGIERNTSIEQARYSIVFWGWTTYN